MSDALVIGHTGQDGSYLFDLLADRGYVVTGISRETSRTTMASEVAPVDILQRNQVEALIAARPFQEIYYLAAFHHSAEMDRPDDHELLTKSFNVHVFGLLNVLEVVACHARDARVFYAASSHVFGAPVEVPQTETTPMLPNCAYGISKQAGVNLMRYYRATRKLFCACGICYNHESPRRSPVFLSRKIVSAAVAIKRGRLDKLRLGDLSARVDWGYAPDYVNAMWRILQLSEPDDFIIASGRLHSVVNFVKEVFDQLDLDWRGYVVEDSRIIKKQPVISQRQGDATKLRNLTGWRPQTDLRGIAKKMVASELERQST